MAEKYNLDEAQIMSIRSNALKGDAEAQNYLGMLYYGGVNVPKDEKRAFELFMQAAQQGNAAACMNVADCYENGEGVEQSSDEAFKWYQKAADLGNPDAQSSVGLFYEFGMGVEKSLEKAAMMYKLAVDGGSTSALYHLGRYHRAMGDTENAFHYFLRAAQSGIGDAAYEVGRYYENGWGTEKNDAEAVSWYTKAITAAQNADAELEMGNRYFEGRGVDKDLEMAARLFAAAAQQGNVQAALNLTKCSEAGLDYDKLIADVDEEERQSAQAKQREEENTPDIDENCCVGFQYRQAYEEKHKKDTTKMN